MKWHPGSVTEAVTFAKSKKAIFVVFIEGEDEASAEISSAIESPEVTAQLEQDCFVAIKLKSGSENYKFFAQIYQLVPVPSIFFLNNGVPLEIIAGPLAKSDLQLKIDLICKKVNSDTQAVLSNLTKTEEKVQGSTSAAEVEKVTTTQTSTNEVQTSSMPTVNPEATPATNIESVSNQSTGISVSTILTPEQKVERAKKLIELQKIKQEQEEQQKQKERELERRRTGRELQKRHEMQQNLEIKTAQRERMKEKAEEAAVKEQVRKQIAEDRAARKQRELDFQQTRAAQAPQERITVPHDNTMARIQFRLPSGGTYTESFESASLLSTVRAYVTQNIELPFRNFSMASFVPRRNLTRNDDAKTLVELELVPNAVILIFPDKSENSSSIIGAVASPGFLSSFVWTLISPVVSMYNYLVGYFTARPRNDDRRNPSGAAAPTSTSPQEAFTAGVSGLTRRNVSGGPGTSRIRTRGNVRTLHSSSDENDENNTWNGNSTQQM